MVVKAYVLNTHKGSFVSFEKKINCRGKVRTNLVKEKIRKVWISRGFQPINLPIIFIKPETLNNISQKLKRKPVEIEIDIRELLGFNSLKEALLKEFTS